MASAPTPSDWLAAAARDLGACLGLTALAHALLWPLSHRESLLHLLWSGALPGELRALTGACAGAALLWGWRARLPWPAAALLAPGALWALWDAAQVWRLGLSGAVHLGGPAWLPASALLAAALAAAFAASRRARPDLTWGWRWLPRGAAAAALCALALLHHVMSVGETDYRRPADTAVVLGAAVWRGGRPSDVLMDRVLTGVRLVKEGRASRLLMTGGTGANGYSEPAVMRDIALREGISPDAIVLDEEGVNTAASVRTLRRLQRRGELGALLIVSHDHHTARLQLACHRLGLRCYTVPAHERAWLRAEPKYILREVVGFVYYSLTFR